MHKTLLVCVMGGNPSSNVGGGGGGGHIASLAPGLKKSLSGGRGGGSNTFFASSKFLGQFSRHGVGVSSYITNLSDKQASKQQQQKALKEQVLWKGGPNDHFILCPSSFQKRGGGGGRKCIPHPKISAFSVCVCLSGIMVLLVKEVTYCMHLSVQAFC